MWINNKGMQKAPQKEMKRINDQTRNVDWIINLANVKK